MMHDWTMGTNDRVDVNFDKNSRKRSEQSKAAWTPASCHIYCHNFRSKFPMKCQLSFYDPYGPYFGEIYSPPINANYAPNIVYTFFLRLNIVLLVQRKYTWKVVQKISTFKEPQFFKRRIVLLIWMNELDPLAGY